VLEVRVATRLPVGTKFRSSGGRMLARSAAQRTIGTRGTRLGLGS
jgi:hypothetical protein